VIWLWYIKILGITTFFYVRNELLSLYLFELNLNSTMLEFIAFFELLKIFYLHILILYIFSSLQNLFLQL